MERIKKPQTTTLEPTKPKQQNQTSSNQPKSFTPASPEKMVRPRAKFDYESTQLGRLIDARKEPNATEASVQETLDQVPTLDPRQTPIDAVDKIGFIDNTEGAELHAYPTGNKAGIKLPPATPVTLIGKYKYDYGWAYIRGIQNNTMIAGWVQTARVNISPPEPRAKLHLIKQGETAEQLARENFADHVKPGQDLRFYENVLEYINKQENRVGVEPAIEVLGVTLKGVDLQGGNLIWLVSPEFAKTLQGVVSNGSITGGAVAKARTANHAVMDTLESITQAIALAPEVMAKDTWEAVRQNWRELLNGLLLFVGAEALSGALAVAPDPTMLSKIAASAIQFGLSAWGATGVVAAGGKSLEFGVKWLNTAIHANGDDKKIHAASLELIRMLELMALTALAAFGAKGNAAKGLKIASEIKLPPMGGQPALATAEGVKLETEPQRPTLENMNESRGSGSSTFSNTAILAFKSYRGVLERMFPSKIPAGTPKDIASKALKIRNDANAIIDTAEKMIQQNPKQETALLELLRIKLSEYFRKVDTEHGRIRLNDNEVIYHTRDEAVKAAKARAGIPEGLKPIDVWEVGGDQKAANIAKANVVGQNDGAEYVTKSDLGSWGRYEVYEVKVNGEKLTRGIVDHTDDLNNPLSHVHAVDFGKLPLSKAELRAANYEAVGKIKHHLAYQVTK